MEIYHGNIVYSESIKELKEIKSDYIVINNGVVHPESPNPTTGSNWWWKENLNLVTMSMLKPI